jgi:alkylhydroperoxidase family enzyme
MSWLPKQAPGATALDRCFGLRPNLYRSYRKFVGRLWEAPGLDPRWLELCRLRVAQLHGCRSELALRHRPAVDAGLREDQVQALGAWSDGPFDAAQRACLAFAEMFVRDPHAISDADAAAVVAHLGEPGLIAFIEALAVFDGFCRMRRMLGVEPQDDTVYVVEAPRPDDVSAH